MRKLLSLLIVGSFLFGECLIKAPESAPDKILKKDGWVYKVWITAKGTRSQGYISKLYFKDKEVCPKRAGDTILTPFGEMFYDYDKMPWGWHGWRLERN
jgi:hypothetical protein